MDLWTVILTIIGGVLCVYFLGILNHNYFKKLGISCVKPIPIFGNMAGMIFKVKTMIDIVEEAYKSNPEAKYVGFYDFSTPIIVLNDPELVKSIAVKNFDSFPNHKMFIDSSVEPLFGKSLISLKDDAWRDMRSLLSPAFTANKMIMMFKTLSQCAVNFTDHLARQDSQLEELDMKETFGRYTLDVIASAEFGLSVDSMKDRDNNFYKMGKSVTDFSTLKMLKFLISRSFPWLAKRIGIRFLDRKTTDYSTNVIETTIATRDEQGIVRPDMIHLMMQARDRKEKSTLTSDDMAAQAFIFFLGGFDSPSTTMSFAAHLLALNPDIQKKLQAEIDQVIENGSEEVSYEDLHAMKYLDTIVSETLRMYPPSPAVDRIGPKSFTLPPAKPGLEPLKINPGQNIWIPIYSFHHDPKYFPEPDKFDPERFNEENKSKINPHIFAFWNRTQNLYRKSFCSDGN